MGEQESGLSESAALLKKTDPMLGNSAETNSRLSDGAYIRYLKNQQSSAAQRLSVNLSIIYDNPDLANIQLGKSLQRVGVKKTLERIKTKPAHYGKLKGRMFLGIESKERLDSKAMLVELGIAVERDYLLRLQVREAERLAQHQAERSQKNHCSSRQRD